MDKTGAYMPSALVEKLLGLLEAEGVPTPINDQIVALVEKWEESLPPKEDLRAALAEATRLLELYVTPDGVAFSSDRNIRVKAFVEKWK